MKFISWNVNGLRACMNKGFLDSFYNLNADFFCLQETKLQAGQLELNLPGYEQYWCYAEKKGYSGTAIFTKHTPLSVSYGLGNEQLDTEGRLITLEYAEFYLVTCYTPNAQRGLARIEHRLKWEEAFRNYLKQLDGQKPVILCGDLNVAHKEIDLKNPKSNRGNAGFSDEERNAFSELLGCGFTDTFRQLYPTLTGAYSWWSYMYNARQNNAGWRIDYFLVSDRLNGKIFDATIHPDIMGSDHCPVGLDLEITCNGSIWSPEVTRPEDPQPEKAGGVSPAGSLRSFFKIAAAVAAVVALIFIGTLLPGRAGNDPSLQTTVAPTTDTIDDSGLALTEVFTEVFDRTGTIEMRSTGPIHALQTYLNNGEQNWMLTPLSREVPAITHRTNFYLQVPFSEEMIFTESDAPQIKCELLYGGFYHDSPYVEYQYYYGYENSIAGAFVYGYCPSDCHVDITASYKGVSTSIKKIPVCPEIIEIDYRGSDTAILVSLLADSQGLAALAESNSDPYIGMIDYINYDPITKELLTRNDCIDWILKKYDTAPEIMCMLLSEPFFSMRMTAEQNEEFEYLKLQYTAKDLEIFYDYVTIPEGIIYP